MWQGAAGALRQGDPVQPEERCGVQIDCVKVFSVTKAKDREYLGEDITRWRRDNQDLEIVDKVIVQSSDREFQCVSGVFFLRQR